MSDALLADLYELTMAAGYHAAGRADEPATFELYFRRPPDGVDVVVACGLDPVLDYLEALRFDGDDLAYLDGLGAFDAAFLAWLEQLRFGGDVWAVPEGTVVFPEQPLLRVSAPLAQGQLVETFLLNRICYSSLVASHAATVVAAAGDTPVLEFGARRAHGPDGALTGSRAALVGGCAATSNVAAGRRYGVPVAGTQAHAWIMAFPSELEAFRTYARAFPDGCVLLVDTYDTLGSGVPNAITVASELAAAGSQVSGVRLDSGDLAVLAPAVRRQLDEAGLHAVEILASGDLDAPRIAALAAAGAPIDGYGVGSAIVPGRADPVLGGVYKLVEIDGQPVAKRSDDPAKATLPGSKQVWRHPRGDVVGLADEALDGQPLLVEVLRAGRRRRPAVPVPALREQCRAAVAAVRPAVLRGEWTVRRSDGLTALAAAAGAGSAPG